MYFIRYFGEFIFYSLLTVYLADKGFSGTQVGAFLSFSPLILAFSLPLWLTFDNGKSRKALILCVVVSMTALMFSLLFVPEFALLAVLMAAYSVARAPLSSSLDSMTYVYCIENNKPYSAIRAYGSAGYIAAVLIGSFLYDTIDFLWLTVIASVLLFTFLFLFLSAAPLAIDKQKSTSANHSYKLLFRNKEFLVYLLIQTVCCTFLTVNNSYDILYQQTRGLDTVWFGVTNLIRVSAEIAALAFLRKKKIGFRYLYLSVPFLMVTQSVSYFFAAPTWSIFVVGLFTGAASGILIYVGNKYISIIVRPRNITVATYVMVIVNNLANAVGIFAGGAIMDALGIYYIYLCTGVAFVLSSFLIAAFVHKDPQFKTDDPE